MFWNRKDALIEYVEAEAKLLMRSQAENRVILERSRDTLMNILLAGAGGSLALAVSLFDKGSESWLFYGVLLISVYLFGLGVLLVLGNSRGYSFLPMGNQPDYLYRSEYKDLDIIDFKELYLGTMQQVINENRENNASFSKWLGFIRLLASATPLWLGVAFLFEKSCKII